jgi:hypothetical protein
MKYLFALIVFLVAACNFAEAIELKKGRPSPVKISFIPYLQLAYGVLPGPGCSVRVQKASFGLQLDANAGTLVLAGVREVTLSLLFYPWTKPDLDWSYTGWNLGIGGGMGHWYADNGSKSLSVFPFFVGYQGQKHFFSVSIHPLDRVELWAKWIPTVKYGWCF